jgi:TonB family protein
MRNSVQKYIHFLFLRKSDGLNNRLVNQLIYSQLKNRLVMMTQKPSGLLAKWKYIGILPLLLMTLLIFSFREKENASSPNIINERASLNGVDDNTEQPLFPGCDKVNEMEKADCSHKKMYEYVASHLKYPEDMKANKVEGKVYVKFVITTNGYVANARVEKSLSPSADKAALDLVNGMNDNVGKWTPGTKEGIPVTMDMVLPISFVLDIKTEQQGNPLTKTTQDVYAEVDNMPRFPGCEDLPEAERGTCSNDKFFKYVYENLKYPQEDSKKGIEGMVMAKFTIQTDGHVANAQIIRGVSPRMDAEVLRIINGMNQMPERWIPGSDKGQIVPVEFTLPVKFALTSGNAEQEKAASGDAGSHPTSNATNIGSSSRSISNSINTASADLHLSPNPATDHTVIDLFEGAKTIFIFTADGVQIAKVDVIPSMNSHYRLDVTKYTPGQYSVQVVSAKESRSGIFTVIK